MNIDKLIEASSGLKVAAEALTETAAILKEQDDMIKDLISQQQKEHEFKKKLLTLLNEYSFTE